VFAAVRSAAAPAEAVRAPFEPAAVVASDAVRAVAPVLFDVFSTPAAAPFDAVSTTAATSFAAGATAAAARLEALSTTVVGSAAAARALPTRAAVRPGEAADWDVTAGVAACGTAVTGAGTPATDPFACAGPADQAATAQATTASVKMLPRHGQASLALINIRG
jgi:hypothetical protein